MLPVLDVRSWAGGVLALHCNKAFLAETGPLWLSTGWGVITGVGGGIIRDTLAREIPLRDPTHRNSSATARNIGGIVHATAFYTFLRTAGKRQHDGYGVTLFIRSWRPPPHLKLPTFHLG